MAAAAAAALAVLDEKELALDAVVLGKLKGRVPLHLVVAQLRAGGAQDLVLRRPGGEGRNAGEEAARG